MPRHRKRCGCAPSAAGGRGDHFVVSQGADSPGAGATNPPAARWTLPETVVTASRVPRDIRSEPATTYRVDGASGTLRRGSRTTADILDGLPSVMGQKTSYAQTSPYLRGFTGYETLALIDGIRLNNSVFRSGPNQYWNTIDPLSIGHYELVMGPGSVLYGSDAVGGVLNALTLDPPAWTGAPLWERRLYYRGATAERSHVGRVQLGGRLSERFGFLGGYSLKNFGDLRGGADVGGQEHTGYDEQDFDIKLNYYLDNDNMLTLGHQSARQDDAWRTHRTIYGLDWEGLRHGNDNVHCLDQARDLTYARYRARNMEGFLNGLELTLSRQAQGEDLYRVLQDSRTQRQGFDVETWGGTLQLESDNALGQWVCGLDYYHDIVDSYARRHDASGRLQDEGIQGPVSDDASYDLAGVFVQDTFSLFDNRLDLTPGIRYTYASADANEVEDPVTGNPTSFSDDWQAVAASLRALMPLTPDRRQAVYGGVSQGFRAPNLSDLTRFDIARSGELEIPTLDLDPEQFITYELGFRTRFERLTSQIAYYYTAIDDLIVRTPTGNSVDGLTEVTKMNSGEGYIHGIELSGSYRFTPQWSSWLSATWQEGQVDTFPTSSAASKQRGYLSRLMPPTVQLGVRWQTPTGKYWTELQGDAAARADKLSAEDRLDTQRIPPDGTPGYVVGTLRAGSSVWRALDLAIALENIFDEDYRVHGSGVNEPGRNVVLTAACAF